MSFNLKKDGKWLNADTITFKGFNFIPDSEIIKNNKANLELIDEWIKPAQVHNDPIILVSGGDSTNYEEMKELIKAKPNIKVMCVKHAFPGLIKNGITPWACVVLDTRPLNEISSLGKNRMELLKDATPETTFFALTRVHPTYTFVLQQKKIKVVGFNNHWEELAAAFNMKLADLKENKELYKELSLSMITLPGSCSALCAINIAIFLGFRELHLFGYDASVKSPKDTTDECFEVEANNKIYYVPKEFVSIGLEFENMFKIYPIQLNTQFYHYGPDTFIGAIYQSTKVYKLQPLQITMKNFSTKSQLLCDLIEKIQGGYLAKPFYKKNQILRAFHSYEDYTKIQTYYTKLKSNTCFANTQSIKIICDYLKKHNSLTNPELATTTTATTATTIEPSTIETTEKKATEATTNKQYKGMCHGVRHGIEIELFKQHLTNLQIQGTELSGDVIKNAETNQIIQWDFHKTKPAWLNSFDFIYSNSLTYSYQPAQCLAQWITCLNQNGLCFIETVETKEPYASQLEPFGANPEGFKELITAKHLLVDTLQLPDNPSIDTLTQKPLCEPLKRICYVIAKKPIQAIQSF